MSDLVSRQAAIDALNGQITVRGKDNAIAVQEYIRIVSLKLRELPSAQPEIVRCKDCSEWHTNCMLVAGKHGCDKMQDYTEPDFYCGFARRRNDDE